MKEILLSDRALKGLNKLDAAIKRRIKAALFDLAADGKHADTKKLKGVGGREDLYRLRVGDYRVIYYPEQSSIKVIRIEHRSKVYEWLD